MKISMPFRFCSYIMAHDGALTCFLYVSSLLDELLSQVAWPLIHLLEAKKFSKSTQMNKEDEEPKKKHQL